MSPTARRARLWLGLLVLLYAAVLFAGVLAPYAPDAQNRTLPFAPPTRLHFVEPTGRVHLRPFMYPLVSRPGDFGAYAEDRTAPYPVHFLVGGAPYRIAGLVSGDRHVF